MSAKKHRSLAIRIGTAAVLGMLVLMAVLLARPVLHVGYHGWVDPPPTLTAEPVEIRRFGDRALVPLDVRWVDVAAALHRQGKALRAHPVHETTVRDSLLVRRPAFMRTVTAELPSQVELHVAPNRWARLDAEIVPIEGLGQDWPDEGVAATLSLDPDSYLTEARVVTRHLIDDESPLPEIDPGAGARLERALLRGSVADPYGRALRWRSLEVLAGVQGRHAQRADYRDWQLLAPTPPAAYQARVHVIPADGLGPFLDALQHPGHPAVDLIDASVRPAQPVGRNESRRLLEVHLLFASPAHQIAALNDRLAALSKQLRDG